MSEAAKQEIIARNKALFDAMNRDDFAGAARMYTEYCAFMPPDGSTLTGRAAVQEAFEKMIPPLKDMVPGELCFFELLNENTAYANNHVKSVDGEGKIRALIRDALLWRKVDGVWYIGREIFNSVPLPAEKCL